MTMMPKQRLLILVVSAVTFCHAFVNNAGNDGMIRQATGHAVALSMVPRFDKSSQKWFPENEKDMEGAYGPIGSLIRQGPVPFFKRLTDPELYDQMVLKYQAGEGVGRMEAQGNIDAFLANMNDWIVQKNAEKRGAAKYDYATANTDPKQIVLTSLWAGIVFAYILRVIYVFTFTKGAMVEDNLAGVSDAVTQTLQSM